MTTWSSPQLADRRQGLDRLVAQCRPGQVLRQVPIAAAEAVPGWARGPPELADHVPLRARVRPEDAGRLIDVDPPHGLDRPVSEDRLARVEQPAQGRRPWRVSDPKLARAKARRSSGSGG